MSTEGTTTHSCLNASTSPRTSSAPTKRDRKNPRPNALGLVDRRDAATLLGISPGTFDARVRPQISSLKVGRLVFFRYAELVAWVNSEAEDAREAATVAAWEKRTAASAAEREKQAQKLLREQQEMWRNQSPSRSHRPPATYGMLVDLKKRQSAKRAAGIKQSVAEIQELNRVSREVMAQRQAKQAAKQAEAAAREAAEGSET